MGLGLRVQGLECRVWGLGLGVQVLFLECPARYGDSSLGLMVASSGAKTVSATIEEAMSSTAIPYLEALLT